MLRLLTAVLCLWAATVSYEWAGQCTDGCTGTAQGVLTLDAGAAPDTFGLDDFISFYFAADDFSYLYQKSADSYVNRPHLIFGEVTTQPSGPWFDFNPFDAVDPGPSWRFHLSWLIAMPNGGWTGDLNGPRFSAVGTGSTFSPIPLPPALPLLLSALSALFGLRLVARARRSRVEHIA